jgi:hypothetical protein
VTIRDVSWFEKERVLVGFEYYVVEGEGEDDRYQETSMALVAAPALSVLADLSSDAEQVCLPDLSPPEDVSFPTYLPWYISSM